MPAKAASIEAAQAATTDATMSQAFWLHSKTAAVAPTNTRAQFEAAHHIRFEHHLLEYYPLEDSRFHVSFGMQKDKRPAGTRMFTLRGVPMFSSSALGVTRKVSPGFAIGYDQPLAAKSKLNFDIGLRTDRDPNASQLVRLAGADESHSLGAHSARFGPAAHLTFIHTF